MSRRSRWVAGCCGWGRRQGTTRVHDRTMLSALHGLDRVRRLSGRALDMAGLGPLEAPSEVVAEWPGVRLRAYGERAAGPALLVVPAPIKRAYIWDLAPGASAVRRCLEAGFAVHLAEWARPGPEAAGRGLETYAHDLLLACVDVVAGRTGRERVTLAGHSLGGTFAAIFAARHPDRVAALVLLEAPLRFGAHAGALAPLVAAAPAAELVRGRARTMPGTFLNAASATAAPLTFGGERAADFLASLPDRHALENHLRVTRWTLDEFPLPARLFEEVVEWLYREDRFMRGALVVGGEPVSPARLEAPALAVVNPESRLIPPGSVLPFLEASASRDREVLPYRGDRGVALQHVGALVGAEAHRRLWPSILRWLDSHATGS
jgi:polyhydroxyalkanoate synthase